MSAQPSVSVIIPVKNGAATLAACLQSIRAQSIAVHEIIVLDSGSADDSIAIAASFGAKIIDIVPQEFNHGLTRNIGVAAATGALCFLTVQDARLADDTMLERMAAHFQDNEVMAVVGHQAVPHERDKNPALWFRRYSQPKVIVRKTSTKELNSLSPSQQKNIIAWDNVIAMYRRTALLKLPFQKTNFAEDWIWSKDALLSGCTLVYDPSIVAYHYHHISFDYAYKVAFEVNFQMWQNFGFVPDRVNRFAQLLSIFYGLTFNANLNIKEKIYWMVYNLLAKAGEGISTLEFRLRLYLGGKTSLQNRYNQLCAIVPQGQQKSQRNG